MKRESLTQYELLLLLGLVIMVVFLLIIVTFSWMYQKKKGKEESRKFLAENDYQGKLNEIRILQEEKERVQFARELKKEITEIQDSIAGLSRIEMPPGLNTLAEKLSASVQKLESISRQIAPAMLSESGLSHALASMVHQFNGSGKADLFFVEKGYKKQDDSLEIMLFRIAHEIISNALKHGKPNRIDVSVSSNDKQIVLEIRDNGLPFDLKQKLSENNIDRPGNGLKNIATRLQNNAELMYTHFEGTNRNKIIYFL